MGERTAASGNVTTSAFRNIDPHGLLRRACWIDNRFELLLAQATNRDRAAHEADVYLVTRLQS